MYFLLPDLGRVLSLHSNLQRLLGITIKLWTPIRFYWKCSSLRSWRIFQKKRHSKAYLWPWAKDKFCTTICVKSSNDKYKIATLQKKASKVKRSSLKTTLDVANIIADLRKIAGISYHCVVIACLNLAWKARLDGFWDGNLWLCCSVATGLMQCGNHTV